MKKSSFICLRHAGTAFAFAFFISCVFWSCQKDQIQSANERYFVPDPAAFATDRSTCNAIILPAGSADALAQAVADVCEGGVIYLRAGEHTESARVIVNKSVKIIGETGAVLKVKSDLIGVNTAIGALTPVPGLHILDAPGTLIQNLTIQPTAANGGVAVLVEKSHQSAVIGCAVSNFQTAVWVELSDRVAVMGNTVKTTGLWQTGQVTEAHGIIIMNGKSAYISDNTVTNSVFGIWACDEFGTCERNTMQGNLIGLILCKVPGAVLLPGSTVPKGAALSATHWKVRENRSNNNLDAGYLVIDGSNNNLLENNDAGSNGTYDYEVVGDSQRFGFLTPFVFNNTIHAKSGQTVKDCGKNSTITGGVMVDTSVDICK